MPCPAPLFLDSPGRTSLFSESSQQRRPGTDIPGYAGFVPRRDDVYGTTFRKANDLASDAAQAGPAYGQWPATPMTPRERRSLSPQARGLLRPDSVGNNGRQVPTDDKARFFTFASKRDRGPVGPVHTDVAANWAANLRSGETGVSNVTSEWRYLRSPSLDVAISPKREEAPQTWSPERQIPGYAGHVPKVGAENIYGKTYRKATEAANMDVGNSRLADDAGSFPARRSSSSRKTASPQRQIAGYTGYIPAVKAENLYGSSYRAANEEATSFSQNAGTDAVVDAPDKTLSDAWSWRKTTLSGSAASNAKACGNNEWSLRSRAQQSKMVDEADASLSDRSCTDSDINRQLATFSPSQRTRSVSRSSRSLSRGRDIPGYSGYVPRKGPGNVYGVSYRAANEKALGPDMTKEAVGPGGQAVRSSRSLSSGEVIPGYQGYVPKVGPRNIFGSTVRKASERAAAKVYDSEPVLDQPVNAGEVTNTWSQGLRGSSSLSRRGLSPERRITGEIPSHIDHAPKKNRGGEPVDDSRQTPTRGRNRLSKTARDGSPSPSPIPGYAGYIPRKGPCNVLGATFAAANERAAAGADPVAAALTETSLLQSDVLP